MRKNGNMKMTNNKKEGHPNAVLMLSAGHRSEDSTHPYAGQRIVIPERPGITIQSIISNQQG